ncbi:PREDICTED: F-box/LRR-repeat/kelch-repeat protein At1g09650-like [Camelina sativa]|uniref:F-box/LRR-repeat/kelch-repeat protein At1g09650-like n=1 Tax=Camelina sativa TaxID=90675 RepID=A0ABM0X525_CAMSA|nr:PREDICTED: F-box/LRR-repeat/kelch-repeat protein At1g09650-like [Camelina sativa]
MEQLHHDIVERILERLTAKSLGRFKSVSRRWKSTIESRYFQNRQLICGGDDPQVLLVYLSCDVAAPPNIQPVVSDEAQVTAVKITPTESENCTFVSQTSCDGLVCLYSFYDSGLVANPTTGWSRCFPPSRLQQLIHGLQEKFFELAYRFPLLGFGKDNLRDTYKPVFLYNSSELGLDNVTTCEVFDFSANSWRYVVPASPHRIIASREPLYFDGSLHWFTEGQDETKVLSFHLHSETFQLISNTPLPFPGRVHPEDIALCSLSNRLCVSLKTDLLQLIWSFAPRNNNNNDKTWVKLYTIDLNTTSFWFGSTHTLALSALSLSGTTNKFLLYDREYNEHKQHLVLHDPATKSFDLLLSAKSIGLPLSYVQSLISIY